MDEPIRIIHVFSGMGCGGAETMIMNLYRKIDRNKVQFDFIVHTNEKYEYDDEIISLGGRIYAVPGYNGMNLISYIKAWKDFFREHPEYKIIHGHMGSTAAIYLKIAKKYGLYTIAHSHSTKKIVNLKHLLFAILSYPTRYIADYFFACSNLAGIKRFGVKVTHSNKYKILKNAIESDKYIFNQNVRKQIRESLNIKDKHVYGHIGSFKYPKNHKFLIEVFKSIYERDRNAVLLLVGDGELYNSIRKMVVDLELNDNVIFCGTRFDIPELLQGMDVFLFPSIYEGLGIVAIEAQASGLYSIVSDAIPKEAFITDYIESVSLKESPTFWADTVLKFINGYERKDMHKEVVGAGYDINNTVKWLENFYLKSKVRQTKKWKNL